MAALSLALGCAGLGGCAEEIDGGAIDARVSGDACVPGPGCAADAAGGAGGGGGAGGAGGDPDLGGAGGSGAEGGVGGGAPDAESDADPSDGGDLGPGADLGDAETPADEGVTPDAGPPPDCRWPAGRGLDTTPIVGDPGRATVAVAGDPCARTFTLATTAALRDDLPANPRVVSERAAAPKVRTRNAFFDGLYALAVEETEENGVDSIRDFAFDNGNPVRCPPGGCFETGRKWNYVWTRDTAYAVDLGLAALDPTRARNSLEFKLSERRGGGDVQIVQDTGTGGSYPVSTDRVVWALGARSLLGWLHGAERAGFAALALDALRNTAEHDRVVAWDPRTGLYRGEQSFLDWREQSYPAWVVDDVVHIAMSQALGTNVGHLAALRLAAELATEAGDAAGAARYTGWADALRLALRALRTDDGSQLSAFRTTGLDPARSGQLDTLGTALAVLNGVLSPEEAAAVVAAFPVVPAGPAVIWPQQQFTPIYHNRGQWPFVTAYWLRAAAAVNNPEAADNAAEALVRGAALNLSHMENLEMVTGRAFVDDGQYSGPVVNSQRQLWSVAAYVALVHEVVFGLRPDLDGLRFAPYLTEGLRRRWFAEADELVLDDLRWGGGTLEVVLALPAVRPEGGARDQGLVAGAITVDGAPLIGALAPAPGHRRVHIALVPDARAAGTARVVSDVAEWRNLFAPRPAQSTAVALEGGRLAVSWATGGDNAADLTWEVLRDGAVVATDLPGATGRWVDDDTDPATEGPCYTVRARFNVSGNVGQHAPPACHWGAANGRIRTFGVDTLQATGGRRSDEHGRPHLAEWGDAEHRLESPAFTADFSGEHLVQATYGNGAGPTNTGITCGVQRVSVQRTTDGAEVGAGYLVLPQVGDWSRWRGSNFVPVQLEAGTEYRVVVGGPDVRAVNMSVFEHFTAYTGGLGGRSGTFNRVNLADLKILGRPGAR